MSSKLESSVKQLPKDRSVMLNEFEKCVLLVFISFFLFFSNNPYFQFDTAISLKWNTVRPLSCIVCFRKFRVCFLVQLALANANLLSDCCWQRLHCDRGGFYEYESGQGQHIARAWGSMIFVTIITMVNFHHFVVDASSSSTGLVIRTIGFKLTDLAILAIAPLVTDMTTPVTCDTDYCLK